MLQKLKHTQQTTNGMFKLHLNFLLVLHNFLRQTESAARLTKFSTQLVLFYHTRAVLTPTEVLEDEKPSEDVSILARELTRVLDTISCSLLEFTHPILTS